MKKFVTVLTIAAFAALSFTSCQKEISNDVAPNGTVKMRIHAASSAVETKTVVSENLEGYYDINWSAGDQIEVLEFVDDALTQYVPSVALTEDASEATFDVELRETAGDSFLYETVYPAQAYSKSTSSEGDTFYRLNISDSQTYSASSFDGDADVLISRPVHENEQPEELGLEYKRIGSAARMVLKGITAGETITKVVFSTEDGSIAGYSKFDPTTAEFLGTYGASKKSIELAPVSATVATGADVVWFRLYAITLSEGFKVVVTTDAATYTKEVDLATANRELAFNDGGLTKFNVAFAAENRESNSTAQYVLVTDASSLSAGDIIRLGCVAQGKAAGAMGANSYFGSVDATIENGVMTSNDAIDIVLGGSDGAWTLTTSEGQITTSAAKALKLNDGTVNTWTIGISDNVATIAAGSFGSIQYNSGSPRFLNYTSSQTAIEIYKLNDGKHGQALSFGNTTEFNVNLGDNFVAPTLSGNMTEVTYSSTNTGVATVNPASGVVSIVGVGKTIIKAEASESDEYRAASASYTITVKANSSSHTIILDGSILTGTATSADTEKLKDGITYVFSAGAKSQTVDGNNKLSSNAAILIGKSGKYIYNKTALGSRITGFKIFANNGASKKVSVSVTFGTTMNPSGNPQYTQTLSTLDSVYDCTSVIPANVNFFVYKVTNANNSQVQFEITYED